MLIICIISLNFVRIFVALLYYTRPTQAFHYRQASYGFENRLVSAFSGTRVAFPSGHRHQLCLCLVMSHKKTLSVDECHNVSIKHFVLFEAV